MKKYFFNKYTVGVIFLVMLLAFIDWLIYGKAHIDNLHSATEQMIQQVARLQKKQTSPDANQTKNETASTSATIQAIDFNPNESSLTEFQSWLLKEQEEMNNLNVNENKKADELQSVAVSLTKEQVKYLSDRLQNRKTPVREKILSAYLLSQSNDQFLAEILRAAVSPIVIDGEPKAHSVAEVQQTQERSIKILLINKAAEIAKTSTVALADFKSSISQIKDPYLKSYAEQKLKELLGNS